MGKTPRASDSLCTRVLRASPYRRFFTHVTRVRPPQHRERRDHGFVASIASSHVVELHEVRVGAGCCFCRDRHLHSCASVHPYVRAFVCMFWVRFRFSVCVRVDPMSRFETESLRCARVLVRGRAGMRLRVFVERPDVDEVDPGDLALLQPARSSDCDKTNEEVRPFFGALRVFAVPCMHVTRRSRGSASASTLRTARNAWGLAGRACACGLRMHARRRCSAPLELCVRG